MFMWFAVEFVPFNQSAIKLVYVHEDEQNQNALGYKIFTLGIVMGGGGVSNYLLLASR